ncbi:MAG: hypothetical protein U0U70_11490 [Chitinophagaceae bacterium]
MLLLRKIDLGFQVTLGLLMFLSLPVLLFYGFLAGLFLLGFVQLISAVSNTSSFLANGMGRKICNYWKYTGLVMASLFICVPLTGFFNPDDIQVLAAFGIAGAVPVAVYYFHIYRQLIAHLSFKHELGALIRSKH